MWSNLVDPGLVWSGQVKPGLVWMGGRMVDAGHTLQTRWGADLIAEGTVPDRPRGEKDLFLRLTMSACMACALLSYFTVCLFAYCGV